MLLRLLAAILHRRPGLRPAASLAHRLSRRIDGEEPARRVGRLLDGSAIVLDLRDHAQRHLYLYGVIEPETTRFVRMHVARGSVVLDIGANGGYYAILCARLGATVHAFEPQPALTEAIRRTAKLNDVEITVVEAACGARAGEAVLYESADPFWGSMATVVPGYYTVSRSPRPVRVVDVDEYCREARIAPTFVKIDVEGYEAEVLAGMQDVLVRHRPTIVCEVALARRHGAGVLAFMKDAGYVASAIGDAVDADVVNMSFLPSPSR